MGKATKIVENICDCKKKKEKAKKIVENII